MTAPLQQLAAAAAHRAELDIGQGEIGGNNRGPYVWSLTGRRTSGAWCAAAVHSWYEQAAECLGLELPWARTHSARKLAARMSRYGCMLPPSVQPEVGDVALWSRGKPWQGHVGVVVYVPLGGWFVTVEGNVGKYPAETQPFVHRLGEPRLLGFARCW
jgi:hypothetical protein